MTNVGSVDRIIRACLGLGLLGLGYYYASYWGLLGLIPLGTAVFGICPAYSMCKINSCKSVRTKP